MNYVRKTSMFLILFVFLSTPLGFTNSEPHSDDPVEGQQRLYSSNSIDISLISGVIVLSLLICSVVAGRLMKKGKVAVKTHHKLAYITLLVALAHGIYNFFAH